MSRLQPKDARQQVCTTCKNTINSQAYINADALKKKQDMENHWWRVITNWTNTKDSNNPMAGEDSLKMPIIGIVEQSTLDSWSSQLTIAGYTVTTQGNMYIVSL